MNSKIKTGSFMPVEGGSRNQRSDSCSGLEPQSSTKLLNRAQIVYIGFISLIYLIGICIVNPFGDFPLNDDWSYAHAAKSLVEAWNWQPIGWTSTTLITHSGWGGLFCLFANCNFNTLRFSTLTLALLGTLTVFILFVTNNRGTMVATIAALTVGFNPIYYELSYTFMTRPVYRTGYFVGALFCEVSTPIRLF